MELRCAGKSARNAGRYYYKCPVNGKHPDSFLWSGEYHNKSKLGSSMRRLGRVLGYVLSATREIIVKGNRESRYSCYCGGKNGIAVAPQVLLCFMGFVLLILGVLVVFRRNISIQCACTHGCNTPSAQKLQASAWWLRDMEFSSYFLLTAAKEIEEKEDVLFYARRKLFVTDEEAVDRESTTESGIYFIDIAPDGQLRTRIEHGSCGSNSPIGWWSHIPK
ncbi:hypothetical protein AAHA92_29495 [Salvia divinorum]|uniref:Zinc finger GRF-type domain-containing protein n=1 Tax=Salvia divinorum TaxID=28513 RepID=A0ABD1G1H4_SALDI